MYSSQRQEYMVPPYQGSNLPENTAGMPTLHPATRQPPPYMHAHPYNIYAPNQTEFGSHSVVHQPQSLNNYAMYSKQQQQPVSGNFSYHDKSDAYLQEPDQQHYRGY